MPEDIIRNEEGEVVARKIPGDPRERVVINPGALNWQEFANGNFVSIVAQLNSLQQRKTVLSRKVSELEEQYAGSGHPYDFSVFVPDTPPEGVTVLRSVIPPDRYVEIGQGKVGAVSSRVAPDTSLSLDVEVNGHKVGEVTLSAGQTRGSVFFNEEVALAPLDNLVIAAPSFEDTALEDLAISISSGALREDEEPETDPCA